MASAAADPSAQSVPPPPEYGGDAVIWSMWLYYGEAQTQSEIAKTLGVSRASVANYLAEARRRGLVSISIAPTVLERISLARALAERYGLAGAHVLPEADAGGGAGAGAGGGDQAIALRRRLGAAAAQIILPHLRDGMTLGVAWGRTMIEVARALPERSLPGATVVQVSGASLGDAESSPEACTALIAGRLGARCRNLHAPAVVSSRALRDALTAEPSIARHFELMGACDAVVFGIGEISAATTWVDTDYITDEVAADYAARGAAGVLIGRFIDPEGRPAPGPLADRQIGMDLDTFRTRPVRIGVAGGREKLAATRAVLAGGYATHLVTDALMATALMEAP